MYAVIAGVVFAVALLVLLFVPRVRIAVAWGLVRRQKIVLMRSDRVMEALSQATAAYMRTLKPKGRSDKPNGTGLRKQLRRRTNAAVVNIQKAVVG